MRQPRAPLPPVDAEPLQALLEVPGERCRRAADVVDHDHADAPRLAVAERPELDRACPRRRRAELFDDRRNRRGGPVAEEGKRDMEVLAWDDTPAREVGRLPGGKAVDGVLVELQRAEQPDSLIPLD